jgi:hypothetical protein
MDDTVSTPLGPSTAEILAKALPRRRWTTPLWVACAAAIGSTAAVWSIEQGRRPPPPDVAAPQPAPSRQASVEIVPQPLPAATALPVRRAAPASKRLRAAPVQAPAPARVAEPDPFDSRR